MHLPNEAYDNKKLSDLDEAVAAAKELIVRQKSGLGDFATKTADRFLAKQKELEAQTLILQSKIDALVQTIYGNEYSYLPIGTQNKQMPSREVFEQGFKIELDIIDGIEKLVINMYIDGIKANVLEINSLIEHNTEIAFPEELNVENIYCLSESISKITVLPTSLKELNTWGCGITSICELPKGLVILNCGGNYLTELPELPKSLVNLKCGGNQLTSLPNLPPGLRELVCNDNNITTLPELPGSLLKLDCSGNEIEKIKLPASLLDAQLAYNKIRIILDLPKKLEKLSVAYNYLGFLPDELPENLEELDCGNNNIVELPKIPKSILRLHFGNYQIKNAKSRTYGTNEITEVPELPDTIEYVNTVANPLTYEAKVYIYDLKKRLRPKEQWLIE